MARGGVKEAGGPIARWTRRLEAGDQIGLFRSAFQAVTTGGYTALLAALAWDEYSSAWRGDSDIVALVFLLLFTVGLAYLWGHWLHSRIQFDATAVRLWDWRGKCHVMPYADVIGVRWDPGRKGPDRVIVHLLPGGGRPSSWEKICVAKSRVGLGLAIMGMIAGRSGLTEWDTSTSRSAEKADALWRPGMRPDPHSVPWWVI
jgi:hypothetical protein